MKRKILFIDRDGTLIVEPKDNQIDQLDKFELMPGVIPALIKLKKAGYIFVMISNQDGLGTNSYPVESFTPYQNLLISILKSQGIEFESVRVCPHVDADDCECRKPKIGLVLDYFRSQQIDLQSSFVIGDRITDGELAENLGIAGILFGQTPTQTWQDVLLRILNAPRLATCQ